jgi:hypothetical protein
VPVVYYVVDSIKERLERKNTAQNTSN